MNIFAIFEGWVKGRYKHKCVRVYIYTTAYGLEKLKLSTADA